MADDQRAENYIMKLPYSVLLSIYQSMDADRGWEALAAETGYTFDKIRLLELEGARSQGSPSRSLLWELSSRNFTVRQLYSHLNTVRRYREMKILEEYVNSPSKPLFSDNGLKGLPDPSIKMSNSLKGLSSPSVSKKSNSSNISSSMHSNTFNVNQLHSTSDVNNSMQYTQKDKCYPGKEMPISTSPPSQSSSRIPGNSASIQAPGMKPNNPSRSVASSRTAGFIQNMVKPTPPAHSSSPASSSSPTSSSSLTSNLSSLLGVESSLDVQMAFMGSSCFSYSEILRATNGFNEQNKLGEGAFGTVYYGVLRQNKCAVKKMAEANSMDTTVERSAQIKRELTSLLKFRHENIVTLYGYALDGESLCLVYQFMPNGSLEDRLMCKNNTSPLVWSQRLNILLGACQGLNFLHTMGEQPLIHGDIKSANILLDKHMEAKIGDLGQAQQASGRDAGSTTSRLTHITRAQATTKLYGTKAYQAREVQTGSQPSTKSDVFAMGVVLLEVFSGEQAYDERREGEQFLSDYFRSQKGESGNEACLSKIDRRGGECPAEVSLAILDIADVCTRHLKRHRPTSVELLQRMVQADELYRQKTGIKSLGMDSMPGSEHSCHLSHSSSPGGSVDNLAGAPHPTHHLSIAPQPGNGFSINVNSDMPSEKHYAMHLHHDKKSNICMPENTNTAAGLCRDTAVHQNCGASASNSHTPIEYFQDGQTPPPAFLLQQAYDSQTTAEKKRISRLSQCRTAADRTGHEEGGEVEVLPQADPAKLAALEQFDRMNLHGNCEEKESNSFQSDPQKLAALKQFDEQVHHQDAQQYVGGSEEQGDDLACDPKKLALLRQFDTVQVHPAVHQDHTDQQEALASDPRKLDALTRFDTANKENAVCSPTVNTQQLASQRALSDTAAEDMFPVSRVDYVVTSQREALEACSSVVQKKQEVDTEECTTSIPDTTWHTEAELTAPSTLTQYPEAQPSSPDENLLCRRQNFFDLYSRALEGMDDDDEEDPSYGNDYDEGAEENSDDAARGWMAGSGVGHCSPSVQEQVCAPMLSGHCHPIPSEQDESVLGYFKQREQHYEKTFNKPQASPC